MSQALLSIRDLKTYFCSDRRWFSSAQVVRAVDGVSFELRRGEVLALVGESGCGKTTLGRSILRLEEPTSGDILFDGIDLLSIQGKALRRLRRRLQIVFQDPFSSLNPRMRIGKILAEPLLIHNLVPRAAVELHVARLLKEVGLEPYFKDRYPHEMSGGQRQRVAIARATSLEPDLLVADEPVSALDVSVQAQILDLLAELQERKNIAMLFISHDLAVVEKVADRVAVMYEGRIVETGTTEQIISRPEHPYTRELLSSARDLVLP